MGVGAGWIVLVEVLIRILFPQPDVFHQLDPVYGYSGIPGKSGRYFSRHGEYTSTLRMNQAGFRDVEHEMAKPPHTYRILFLGDSYTESKEVTLDETFWRKLQTLLPALPDGRKVEIISMGVSGYGTGHQWMVLEHKGLAMDPDLVVVAFTESTDVWNNSRHLDSINDGRDPGAIPMKPYFKLNPDTLDLIPFQTHDIDHGLTGFFRRHFQTYLFVRNLAVANPTLMRIAWKLGFVHTPPTPPTLAWTHPLNYDVFRTDLAGDTHWVEAWSLTERLFLEIDRTCRSGGARLLVVDIPSPHQLYKDLQESEFRAYPDLKTVPLDWGLPGRRLDAFLADHGIAFLYLYPIFRTHVEENPSPSMYFKIDAHLSPHGHDRVASQLKLKILELVGPGT